MRFSRAFAPAVVALGVALPSPAVAAGDAAVARKAFQQGVTLFQHGDYQGARAMFLQADRERHSPAITYNLGRVEEQLGKMQGAVDAYESYIAEVGENGEFSQSAAIAIAQIKKRSTRLRIETTPSGAHIFLDGATLKETTPASILVTPGNHHVSVEWFLGTSHWSDQRDVDIAAGESTSLVSFESKEAARGKPIDIVPPPPPPEPSDMIFGGAFEIIPYVFFRNDSTPANGRIDKPAAGVIAGIQGHVGYAISPTFELLLRGFAWVGSEGSPATYAVGAGPAFSVHATKSFWVGLGLIGGRAYTCRGDCPGDKPFEEHGRQWRTNLVFAAQLDFSYILIKRSYGEWMLSFSPGMFFANAPPFGNGPDTHMLFFPIGFGVRSY